MAMARVRYKGISDVRVLPASTLAAMGISVKEDLVFSASNLYALDLDLTPAMEDLFRAEGTFTIQPLDDDQSPKAEEFDINLTDDTAGAETMVDEQTGQRSKRK